MKINFKHFQKMAFLTKNFLRFHTENAALAMTIII